MGSAYDHLSREQLLELLASQSEPAPARDSGAPVSGERYRQMIEEAADGIFVADASGVYLDVNEVGARMLGMTRDEVIGRHVREVVSSSEQRFRALTAAAFEGIGISERGVVVDVNDQLARLLGYERHELIGRAVTDIVAPEHLELVAAAKRSGRETPYRHLALRKDGTTVEVEAQAKLTDWAGRPVRVTAIRDVTEQLRLEERLHRVQKLEALGRLAGGIAHDFNNILVAIFSYTDLADLDAEDPAQVRSHMEGLRAAAHRARDLVLQILTFSRQKGEERSRANLQPVVQEALKFLRSSLPASIELDARIDTEVPAVLGAPVQLHQVVMNLCVNAAHAMHPTGKLSLGLSRANVTPELRQRVPELSSSVSYVLLTVQDTGRGMDTQTLSRIFEPFFTAKANGEGSGLGLAVVHGIVKAHDGVIAVESSPNQGTRFEVYIPAADQPASTPP